jgi:hypothetical protein
MSKKEKDTLGVESVHVPERIFISGFDMAHTGAHMLEWLRRDTDFENFVVRDIENELYAQDTTSQLLSVHCMAQPVFETKVRIDGNSQSGAVTQLLVKFHLCLRVRASNGILWKLEVALSYQAINIDMPDEFQLRLSFTILDHQVDV